MGFGLSFGKKKSSVNSTGTIDKLENTNQTGVESTNSTQSGTQTNQTNQTGSTQGTSSTNQASQQLGSTTNQSNVTGSQSSFSDNLAGDIESTIAQLLGGVRETGEIVGSGVGRLQDFDADNFVNGITSAARARSATSLDESVNGIASRIGSSIDNNSMAALLQQRAVNDSNASLAGIESQATGAAQEILARNLSASSNALNQTNDIGVALTNALKGGNVSSTQSTLGQELQNILNQSAGTTNTAESTAQQSDSAQQTTQVLASIINNLLSGSTQTTGTETNNTKTKSGGFGLSLGF